MEEYLKELTNRLLDAQAELAEKRVQIKMLTELLWENERNDRTAIVYTKEVRKIFGILPYPESLSDEDE